MATYNGELYISEQISSILAQLGPDDEVIVSDDGSADSTVAIIRSFEDPRISIIQGPAIGSVMKNFESALCYANGKYIFLCDQDDTWLPDKVQHVTALLVEYDLVLTDCKVVDQVGQIIHDSFFKLRGSQPGFFKNLFKNSYIGCCMAFRREVLSYALPFPTSIHMHDWWIGLLVERLGHVYFYPRPLIAYRRHGNNASRTGEQTYHWKRQLSNRLILAWFIAKRLIYKL